MPACAGMEDEGFLAVGWRIKVLNVISLVKFEKRIMVIMLGLLNLFQWRFYCEVGIREELK